LDAEASSHQKACADAWERGADQMASGPIRHCEQSESNPDLGCAFCGSVWIASLSLAMTTSRFLYSPDDSQRRVLQFVRETNLSLAKRNISLAN
jgi:hypothetical protein